MESEEKKEDSELQELWSEIDKKEDNSIEEDELEEMKKRAEEE